MSGGDGDDYLRGGDGDDTLTGGDGTMPIVSMKPRDKARDMILSPILVREILGQLMMVIA